jgi:hypothetical protein
MNNARVQRHGIYVLPLDICWLHAVAQNTIKAGS